MQGNVREYQMQGMGTSQTAGVRNQESHRDTDGVAYQRSEDVDTSVPRVRAESVTNGNDERTDSSARQHHFPVFPALAGRSSAPTSFPRGFIKPTYSLCGARLRWVDTHAVSQLLLRPKSLHSCHHDQNDSDVLPVLSPAPKLPHKSGSTERTLQHKRSGSSRELLKTPLCHANQCRYQPDHILFVSFARFDVDTSSRRLTRTRTPQQTVVDGKPNFSHSSGSGDFTTDAISDARSRPTVRPELSEEITSSESRRSCGCDSLSKPRFVSTFTMPVPESFRSEWSIHHIPSLHISASPDKLKKLRGDKEIRRDDNHNIEEVIESEVPASRLRPSQRHSNGYHQDDADEALPQRSLPDNAQYSESVTLSRIPAHQEYRYGMRTDISNLRHYRDEVRLVPGQTNPGRYYSTMTQCFINSNYRRHRETVFIRLNAPNPKNYTTSVFVFPKSSRETFVSEVEHHDEETIKWYKVGVQMEARDYVSVSFMQIN